MTESADYRYPIGELVLETSLDAPARAAAILEIVRLPTQLSESVDGLTGEQLDTPYRPGGWTLRQVVHHLVDSHLNAYIRCKLMVSEENPPLKGYDQDAWAEMPDARTMPIEVSLPVLTGIHRRWATFLRSLSDGDFARPAVHSENGAITLDTLLQTYSWHGRHHVAHINQLCKRNGW